MSELEQYDTEVLKAELERRQKEEEEKLKPRPLAHPTWVDILRECQWYIDYCHEHGREPKDAEHGIYSATITAVYGRNVWDWIRNKVP